MNVSKDAHILLDTEQAHACIEHAVANSYDPIHQLVQLTYLKQVIDQELATATKKAMPMLRRLKEQRNVKFDQYVLNTHGVMIRVLYAKHAFVYTKNEVYRRLATALKKHKRAMRDAVTKGGTDAPPAMFCPERQEVIVYLSGNLKDHEQQDEELED